MCGKMKNHGTGKYNFVERFLLHKWRELYIQPSFGVGRVGMPSKTYHYIPDSQGQVSSNVKL